MTTPARKRLTTVLARSLKDTSWTRHNSTSTQPSTIPIANRAEGSIGTAFASLSTGMKGLPPRFQQLKNELLQDNAAAILKSWDRLLKNLASTTLPKIQTLGPDSIPSVEFSDLKNGNLPEITKAALRESGVLIVRGIVSATQALEWKAQVREYALANPQTKGYPADNIQIYELYWAKSQLEARAHPNMLAAQRALNRAWHSSGGDDVVDLSTPITYCDRLRIRTPGDRSFNLGPHLDGGSLERWEDLEYRKCYSKILEGNWEEHDGFDVSPRLKATVDMYNGPGGCSAFRSYQGWLSLSDCGPTNGTLRVIPNLRVSTAYTILRPLVRRKASGDGWEIDNMSSTFHGAAMGAGQELDAEDHSHLNPHGFVPIPHVRPGDAVFWHCDTAHMVEPEHQGSGDSSVLYIPSAPLCDINSAYLKRQRDNFLKGTPPPDFPGGVGEGLHIGRGEVDDLTSEGKVAMGCGKFQVTSAMSKGERIAAENANSLLGF